MSRKDPVIITIPNPVLLDKAISNVQSVLANIPWLQYIFGRAYLFEEDRRLGAESQREGFGIIKTPKVYTGKTTGQNDADYEDCFPNDWYRSYCFFYAEGDETTNNYEPRTFANYTRPMSLIFWMDLNQIDDTKDYVFTEDLKYDVLQELKKVLDLRITGYTDGNFNDVFRGFEPTERSDRLNLRYPYGGMRFYFDLSYDEGNSCT